MRMYIGTADLYRFRITVWFLFFLKYTVFGLICLRGKTWAIFVQTTLRVYVRRANVWIEKWPLVCACEWLARTARVLPRRPWQITKRRETLDPQNVSLNKIIFYQKSTLVDRSDQSTSTVYSRCDNGSENGFGIKFTRDRLFNFFIKFRVERTMYWFYNDVCCFCLWTLFRVKRMMVLTRVYVPKTNRI